MAQVVNHAQERIFLVEADPEARAAQQQLLSDEGYVVVPCLEQRDAFAQLEACKASIVWVAVSGPSFEGIELCRSIRNSPRGAMTFIIVTIDEGVGYNQLEALSCLEVDEVITKPYRAEHVIAAVSAAEQAVAKRMQVRLERQRLFQYMDVLLIQDGGCAPGYDPVTAFIVSHLERYRRRAFAAVEGFRSLVQGGDDDFRRVIYSPVLYRKEEHLPGVERIAQLAVTSGARFRSERFPDFKEASVRAQAVQHILDRNVNAIIAIGGNGTFQGIRNLAAELPPRVQTFFVPVTIDSDISGTECIGQHTGIEEGARKIAGYLADARTHKRAYFIEMMGAGADFTRSTRVWAGLPTWRCSPGCRSITKKTVDMLNQRDYVVVVVAEGYQADRRPAGMNAAEYLYQELLETGLMLRRRVICEPFSRDIRGAQPNNQDITLAQRMAFNVVQYLIQGQNQVMPAVLGLHEEAVPFSEIHTNNAVHCKMVELANRIFL